MKQALSTQHVTRSTKNDLTDDLQFLVNCCKTDLSDKDIESILSFLSQITNHQSLLALNADTPVVKTKVGWITAASQHGILPLVYKTIKKIIKDDSSRSSRNTSHVARNTALLHELKVHYQSIAHRNMFMTSELIKIMNLLRENHIQALAFKGPALSRSAYGDITLRQFGDLDILIQRSDIPAMIDLLTADRYVPELALDTKMKETFLSALNVIGFYKSATNVLIEVHWELLSKNYAITWDQKALWTQKRNTVSINGTDIPLLPPEEHLLYLCVHGSKHLFERLEWVCDIDRSIRADPDINWDYLLNEAEKRGIQRMFFLGLALCQQFFGLSLPDNIRNEMEKDQTLPKLISKIIEIHFSQSAKQGKSYGTFGLLWSMRENLSDRLRFARYAFFAPKFDDFNFIQLPKPLTFLYPIIRPFRLLTKYFKQ
jgi:hypothetical protein